MTGTLIDMVVFVDGRLESGRAVEWAARLARAHGARLTSVCVAPAPAYSEPEMFARARGQAQVIAAGGTRSWWCTRGLPTSPWCRAETRPTRRMLS